MVKQVITRSSVSPRIDENVEEHLENHLDKHIKTTYLIMKRILDIIFSLLALVLLCPIFLIIICCISNIFRYYFILPAIIKNIINFCYIS